MITNRAHLLDNLILTLQTFLDGDAPYVHNLSGDLVDGLSENAKRVRPGRFRVPAVAPAVKDGIGYPFLCVYDAGCDGEGGPVMTRFSNVGSVAITAWAAGSAVDPRSRLAAAGALEVDLKRALYSNLQLRDATLYPDGLCHSLEIASATFDGAQLDSGAGQDLDKCQHGVVVLVVSAYWEDDLPEQRTP